MSTTYNNTSLSTTPIHAMQSVYQFMEEARDQHIDPDGVSLIGLLCAASDMSSERVTSLIQTTTAQAQQAGFDPKWSTLIGFCSALGYKPETLFEAARTVQGVSSNVWEGTSTGGNRSFTTT